MYEVSDYMFSMIYSINYIFSIYMIYCFLSVYLYRLITFFKFYAIFVCSVLHVLYYVKLGMGELRVMWGGGGGIIRASTFTWFPLFSRELIILETKRSSFGFIICQFEKFYVKVR
jgi:hypothetical protein